MSLFQSKSALLACATALSLSFAALPALSQDADKPGEGVSVTPLKSSIASLRLDPSVELTRFNSGSISITSIPRPRFHPICQRGC